MTGGDDPVEYGVTVTVRSTDDPTRIAVEVDDEPVDDQPGYVVAEFRVNGDGWHHYYGWPDAPAVPLPRPAGVLTTRPWNLRRLRGPPASRTPRPALVPPPDCTNTRRRSPPAG